MRKVALGWLVVMLAVLGLCSSGSAAPPPVTREVGENAACIYHTIAAAIAAANPGDTIKVQHAVFYESPLVVNKSLTLIGGYVKGLYGNLTCLGNTGTGRATVRPAAVVASPLFHVQGAHVSVDWFIFENGAGAGVAVDSGGILDLENSIVQKNGDGGLSVVGATASLLETEILGNDRGFGGGIFMNSGASVTASASLIKDNQGWDQGAGVYLRGGSVFSAIEGTRIELNVTPMDCEDGGGIAAIGAGTEVTIDASQVLSNTALTRGGGLYIAGGAQAWIQNGSWVRENRTFGPVAGGGGGAHVTGETSSLHVDGSVFYKNSSDPNGGGIYADGGTVHVNNSWLYDNLGGDSGGGLYNNGGSVTCRNSTFYLNRVLDYHGGGIYSIGIADTLDVEQCVFLENTTDSGNGGAIYAKHPYTSVRRSYFSENTAPGDGSALFLSGMDIPGVPEAEVVNNYIVDNPTTVVLADAGAVATAGIEGPEGPEGPPANGSSLYAEHITAYLRHNTFAHQSQLYHFGVLANAYATVHMVNNIFANFSVAIHQPTPVTGGAYASFTLFWNNLFDYGTGVVISSDEVAGDPAFAGPGNYNLTAASAAINAGTDAGVTLDYWGGHRPWGGGFEIGAEEYPRQEHVFLPLAMR